MLSLVKSEALVILKLSFCFLFLFSMAAGIWQQGVDCQSKQEKGKPWYT
jgi:hypothetical protein